MTAGSKVGGGKKSSGDELTPELSRDESSRSASQAAKTAGAGLSATKAMASVADRAPEQVRELAMAFKRLRNLPASEGGTKRKPGPKGKDAPSKRGNSREPAADEAAKTLGIGTDEARALETLIVGRLRQRVEDLKLAKIPVQPLDPERGVLLWSKACEPCRRDMARSAKRSSSISFRRCKRLRSRSFPSPTCA